MECRCPHVSIWDFAGYSDPKTCMFTLIRDAATLMGVRVKGPVQGVFPAFTCFFILLLPQVPTDPCGTIGYIYLHLHSFPHSLAAISHRAELWQDTVSADEEDDEVDADQHAREGRSTVRHDAVVHHRVPVFSC